MVRSRYGLLPDDNYAQAADAMDIVFDALKRANVKNTPDSLAEDRAKVRDAIAAVKNYHALSGKITFCADPTPECRDGNRQPLIVRYASGGANATHEILQRP